MKTVTCLSDRLVTGRFRRVVVHYQKEAGRRTICGVAFGIGETIRAQWTERDDEVTCKRCIHFAAGGGVWREEHT